MCRRYLNRAAYLYIRLHIDHRETGVRHGIPRLWAYFLLDQVLPVSFTQNLFLLAILLTRGVRCDHNTTPTSTSQHIAVGIAFLGALGAIPSSTGAALFLPMILLIRTLLALPYLALRPPQRLSARSFTASSAYSRHKYVPFSVLIVGGCAVIAQVQLTIRATSLSAIAKALNDHPAARAMGWDFFIAGLSLGIWAFNKCPSARAPAGAKG